MEAQTTKARTKPVPCDPRSIEHGVRQFLADKVMGNLAGVWLLVPSCSAWGPGTWCAAGPDKAPIVWVHAWRFN